MAEASSLELEVPRKVDLGLHLAGIIAVAAAVYHTGRTGNWEPLMAVCMALSLVVLFVSSE